MVDGAKDLTKAAQEQQAAAMKMQQNAMQPTDPNDPIWAPIEGVTLDKYAEISAGLLKKGIAGPDNVNAFVESMGVKPGTWGVVQSGWAGRMASNMAVRTRWGTIYDAFLK